MCNIRFLPHCSSLDLTFALNALSLQISLLIPSFILLFLLLIFIHLFMQHNTTMPRTMRASHEEQQHRHQHHHHHHHHYRKRSSSSPENPYLGLKYYWNKINTDKTVFTCPYCTKSLTSKNFEYHVSNDHDHLDPRHCCVWCNGTVSWLGKKKTKHIPHLISCWRSFLAAVQLLPSSSLSNNQDKDPLPLLRPPPTPASPQPSTSHMDDHDDPLQQPTPVQYVWNLPDRASDMIWLLPVKTNLLTFENDAALKPAVSAVQMFLKFSTNPSSSDRNASTATTTASSSCSSSTITTLTTTTTASCSFNSDIASSSTSFTRFSSTTNVSSSSATGSTSALCDDDASRYPPLVWYHILVAVQVYQQFLDMMDQHGGQFNTLPYSCWCMVKMDGSCHRHLIVVTNNTDAFLQNVRQLLRQQQQRPEFVPSSICLVRIETALNLVDTLGNLSDQRRTRTGWCPFPSGGRIRAYYAIKKLPIDFRLALLMQWNNGVLQDDQYKELQCRDDKGKRLTDLKVRAVNYISRDHFIPCHYPTGYMLHLIWGEKVYFRSRLSITTRSSNALTPATVIRYPVAAAAATGTAPTTKMVKLKGFPFRVRLQKDLNR